MVDRQLRVVQILRGVAALSVVLAHLVAVERKYLPGPPLTSHFLELGAAGVDLFFVISGFIMTTITIGRQRRPGETRRFLFRRFTRIYPLYWIYFALLVPLFLLDPGMVNSTHGRPDLWTSFFLFPDQHLPLLIVAWTLSYELYFYLVYAFIYRVLNGTPVALLVWAGIIAAGNVVLQPDMQQPVLHVLFNPLGLEFIAGCFVARLAGRSNRTVATMCLAGALLIMMAGGFAFGTAPMAKPVLAWTRVMIYGAGAALLLFGALGWESESGRLPRICVDIGDASYSLYLSHVLVLGAIGWVWEHALGDAGWLNHLALLTVCVVAALVWCRISFRVAERPLIALSREALHRLERRAAPAPTGAASSLPL